MLGEGSECVEGEEGEMGGGRETQKFGDLLDDIDFSTGALDSKFHVYTLSTHCCTDYQCDREVKPAEFDVHNVFVCVSVRASVCVCVCVCVCVHVWGKVLAHE